MGYVTVKALQPFYGTQEGKVVANQEFPLSKAYAEDLERRGMVVIQGVAKVPVADDAPAPVGVLRDEVVVKPDTKSKPAPNNKMAPAPDNKAA